MFRSLVKRLVLPSHCNNLRRQFTLSSIAATPCRFSTEANPNNPFAHQNPLPLHQQPETLGGQDAKPQASPSASWAGPEEEFRGHYEHRGWGGRERGSAAAYEYQEEQARLLQAALRHVIRLGWSEAAMISGAKDVGLSPSIVGSFPRKEAAFVEYFMDVCLKKLIDRIDLDEELGNLIQSNRIAKLVRIRLEMLAPYISKWPQALSIQAQPMNIPKSFKQRAMLIDEIWHAAGDQASDIDWYAKRTALGGIYSATEIYMLTDNSPDFRDTWTFLGHRVKDAFDIGKTVQEAKYLAEAVGEGIGRTLQGIMRSVGRR